MKPRDERRRHTTYCERPKSSYSAHFSIISRILAGNENESFMDWSTSPGRAKALVGQLAVANGVPAVITDIYSKMRLGLVMPASANPFDRRRTEMVWATGENGIFDMAAFKPSFRDTESAVRLQQEIIEPTDYEQARMAAGNAVLFLANFGAAMALYDIADAHRLIRVKDGQNEMLRHAFAASVALQAEGYEEFEGEYPDRFGIARQVFLETPLEMAPQERRELTLFNWSMFATSPSLSNEVFADMARTTKGHLTSV